MNYSSERIAGTAADMPRTSGLLEQQINRVGSKANEIDGIATRLHEIADRVFGTEPSKLSPAGDAKSPRPPYAAGQLSEAHDALDRATNYLGRVLARFEAL